MKKIGILIAVMMLLLSSSALAVLDCTFGSATVSRGTYTPTQTFTVQATDGTNASAAYIKFGNNGFINMTAGTAATSGTGYTTFTYSGNIPEGIYTVTAFTENVSDTADCTALAYVDIDEESTLQQAASVIALNAANEPESKDNTWLIIGVVVVAAILISKKN